jgi:hypothetical protein
MGGCLWIYRDKKLLDLCAFFHYFIPAGLKATNVSYTTMWLLKLLENLIAAVSVSGIVTLEGTSTGLEMVTCQHGQQVPVGF